MADSEGKPENKTHGKRADIRTAHTVVHTHTQLFIIVAFVNVHISVGGKNHSVETIPSPRARATVSIYKRYVY